MDELVKQSIATVEQRKKTAVPWTLDEPHNQPYYRFENGKWEATTPKTEHADPAGTLKPSDKLALYTWNIDFMLPYPDSRMRAALHHLETLCRLHPPTTHPVIFLQECLASDLTLLASSPWVQANFRLTDLTPASWASADYGTTTLLSNRLSPSASFRIHYSNSRMQRDVLVLDIPLALCARYMHNPVLHASVLAGDLNAIQDFDRALHSQNGVKDAYLQRNHVLCFISFLPALPLPRARAHSR
ncbi:hypothetical protein LTR48_001940 [Friedmanniomyces endolithicus]|nr:hypothetical protein LTR48_001940 [Friedmanniomyces endolithicus]